MVVSCFLPCCIFVLKQLAPMDQKCGISFQLAQHGCQVYPEYVVLYKRLRQNEIAEPLPKELPFLLELPLYWKNVSQMYVVVGAQFWAVFHQFVFLRSVRILIIRDFENTGRSRTRFVISSSVWPTGPAPLGAPIKWYRS